MTRTSVTFISQEWRMLSGVEFALPVPVAQPEHRELLNRLSTDPSMYLPTHNRTIKPEWDVNFPFTQMKTLTYCFPTKWMCLSRGKFDKQSS